MFHNALEAHLNIPAESPSPWSSTQMECYAMAEPPPKQSSIFRKVSIERLSSPEQLDQLTPVTSPLNWTGLAAVLLFLATILFWGFWGEAPSKVHGQGILLKKESLHDVVSIGAGRIESLSVHVEDVVHAGSVLAVLSQPDLEYRIKEAEGVLRGLEAEKALLDTLEARAVELRDEYLKKRQVSLHEVIKVNEGRIESCSARAEQYATPLEKGRGGRDSYHAEADRCEKAIQENRVFLAELDELSAQRAELSSRREKDLKVIRHKIDQTVETIRTLREKLELHGKVISPRSGRILEIYKDAGNVINAGEPLVSMEVIESVSKPLTALLYFHPIEGKRVQPGMEVHVSPSVVKREEYGNLVGEVIHVSGFPASQRGMLRVLRNEDLVKSLCASGAPIVATVALSPDPASAGKYRWTSGKGPPLALQSGTLCSAGVVVSRQTPASMVLPFLKKHVIGTGDSHVQSGS